MRRRKTGITTGLIATVGLVGWFWVTLVDTPPQPSVSDLPYGKDQAQRFDVWRPEGKGPFPVVLAVHGGGFAFGDKRGHDGLAEDIAVLRAHGIAVASTNYRTSDQAPFPAAAQDVTAALAELHRQAPSLGLDPNHIALWGKSAGANLALLVGLAAGRRPIGDGMATPVVGIIAMYPPIRFDVMDAQLRNSACGDKAAVHDAAESFESKWLGAPLQSRPDLVAQASPLTYVSANSPPVLVQAGSADCMVPHKQSIMLADAMRKAGAPVRIDILPGAKHIDAVFDEPENLRVVVSFLKKIFAMRATGA